MDPSEDFLTIQFSGTDYMLQGVGVCWDKMTIPPESSLGCGDT